MAVQPPFFMIDRRRPEQIPARNGIGNVHYISTRGKAPSLPFSAALLSGLATDGGLYVPQSYPYWQEAAIAGLAGQSFAETVAAIIAPYIGPDLSPDTLKAMIDASYATFRHAAVAPLVQIGDNLYLLELFHGPTLAFKDVAMQLLGRMMDYVLRQNGRRATIVGATSGDTGAAAIEAFRGLDNIDLFILYPHGRVSEVQRRQMTGVDDPNIHVIALEGTFDDAQSIVKGLFNRPACRDELGLSGVNSINWARILAQITYYFTAAVSLGGPHRAVAFSVPTGNFGDIFAGYVAKRMGLPIDLLTIATNSNDILVRALASGQYRPHGVVATQSPSMDIQVSSNFERLIFEANERDASKVCDAMAHLSAHRQFEIAAAPLARIRSDFAAAAVLESETTEEMQKTYRTTGLVIDPHTAVGVAAARRRDARRSKAVPTIVLATAHPAKFPQAVEAAIGVRPVLPPHLADLMMRREHFTVLPNDLGSVESFLRSRARAARHNSAA
jgi:threonine synthase